MFRHTARMGMVTAAFFAAQAVAQTPPAQPAAQPTAKPQSAFNEPLTKQRNMLLIQRYGPLFADIYSLNNEQKQGMNNVLEEMAKADLEYFRKNDAEMTQALADIRLNSQKMTEAGAKDPAEREKLKKMQDAAMAKYRGFQVGSPMNIEKIAESIEKTLPKEQAEKGHQVFLQRKPYGLRPPPTAVSPQQQLNQQPPTPPAPTDPKVASPTQFRTPTLAAPTLDRWNGIVEAVITHHTYTDIQKTKARAIFHDINARAHEYMKAKGTMIAETEKTPPSAERSKKLTDLYNDLDLAYDELRQRIEQLSQAGQVHATTTLDFAPPVDRWTIAIDRIIAHRNYNETQATEARRLATEASQKGDEFMKSHGSELTAAGMKPDQMHGAYEPLDKMFQELKAAVEKLGPPPPEVIAPAAPGGH